MRLTLLCQGATPISRQGGFPSPSDPIDPREQRRIEAMTRPAPERTFIAPDAAATGTAERLGCDGEVAAALRDMDFGAWSGRTFAEVAEANASGLSTWLAAPWSATPDGEAFADVIGRIGKWLDSLAEHRSTLVVAGSSAIRAILCQTLEIPTPAAMRIDIAPLGTVVLSRNGDWRLQALAA